MAWKNKVFRETMPFLEKKYGKEMADKVISLAEIKYKGLLDDNRGESREVRKHTAEKIYPCISLYRSMVENGIEKKECVNFLDRTHSERAVKDAVSIQRAMKIPGMYKLMPKIFRWVTLNQFGEAAGFKAQFYNAGKGRVKFDMTKCLYCDVCRREGVPEDRKSVV